MENDEKWKPIDSKRIEGGHLRSDKLEVPGGWLYRSTFCSSNHSGASVHQVFVPVIELD